MFALPLSTSVFDAKNRDERAKKWAFSLFSLLSLVDDSSTKRDKKASDNKKDASTMSTLLGTALLDAERVVKKQKTASEKTAQALDGVLRVLEEAQANALKRTTSTTNGGVAADASVLAAASEALKRADASGVVAAATKDLHGAVGKLGKVLYLRKWRMKKRTKKKPLA